MLFNSVIFILLFLPLSLIGWYGLQRFTDPRYARLFLVGMSLWFYGYYNPWYLALLGGSVLCNQCFSKLFTCCSTRTGRRWVLGTGLVFNLGLLFYFKYFNFFINNCNFFLHTDLQVEKIALPLGISFFTFQQVSFLVDRYREDAPCYGFLEYACFVTYFPQLVAGPIVLHSEFIPQLRERKNRTPYAEQFFDGAALFILGLGKKVLLADVLAIMVNTVFDDIAIIPYYLDAPTGILAILFYMLELYFDFSGYCDMARGIAAMFGFILPVNFHSPLKAESVQDFWRRWHITLSRFLTTYIYIPLGGNRKGKFFQCLNLFIVFIASGFWHGANWTFVVFGILHGTAIVLEALFPILQKGPRHLKQFITMLFFMMTLILFRSDSLTTAFIYFRRMFTVGWSGYLTRFATHLQIPENYAVIKLLQLRFPQYLTPFYLICMGILLFVALLFIRGREAEEWIREKACTLRGILCLATVFTWSFISLSQVSTFLYFNF
ncbi:MAG: MBOAT family protein [Lachnospiraceae bacterium]|nr:MBOAT family protein [Lachnospiraceae bacterium]